MKHSSLARFVIHCLAAFLFISLTSAQFLVGGAFNFSVTNTSGLSFKVYSATNVALAFSNWTLLGSMTESSAGSGQYQFTDTQATNGAGFYRIVSGPKWDFAAGTH